MHENSKTLCMKMFPKLAQRTNLTPEELKAYYQIRFNYMIPYNEKVKQQEQNLLSLAMALLRGGKVRFELTPEGEVDNVDAMEEHKSHSSQAAAAASIVSANQIGIQFNHDTNSVTVDQENEVME